MDSDTTEQMVGLYCLATGCDWNDRHRHCTDAERALSCPRKFTRNPTPKRVDMSNHDCAAVSDTVGSLARLCDRPNASVSRKERQDT